MKTRIARTRRNTTTSLLRSAGFGAGAAMLAAGVLASAPMSAQAAAKISGTPQAVSIQAQNSSIEEVLTALGRDFNLHYRSSADLNAAVSGTYQGPLRRVVARLLEGYNFVMRSGPDGLQVTVLGNRNAPATGGVTITASHGPASKAAAKTTVAADAAKKTAAPQPGQQVEPAPAPGGKTPAAAARAPEIKVAEGPMPVPRPVPGGKSLPAPTPNTSNLVVPPAPKPGAKAGAVPEYRPAKMAPPLPPQPGSGSATNGKAPAAPAKDSAATKNPPGAKANAPAANAGTKPDAPAPNTNTSSGTANTPAKN